MILELAVPVLSAVTTTLGSAVVGYRMRRRAKQVKDAVVRHVVDSRALHKAVDDINKVKESVIGSVDEDKALSLIKGLIAKHGLSNDDKPQAPAT